MTGSALAVLALCACVLIISLCAHVDERREAFQPSDSESDVDKKVDLTQIMSNEDQEDILHPDQI